MSERPKTARRETEQLRSVAKDEARRQRLDADREAILVVLTQVRQLLT